MKIQTIEYKSTWRDEYLKWLCGYANAQGGILYVGKDDNGMTIGIENAKKLSEDLPNKIRDVLGIVADVNILEENGREYIEIIVQPSSFPVNFKGEYHYRSGSTKQLLIGMPLTQFLMKKMNQKWDAR